MSRGVGEPSALDVEAIRRDFPIFETGVAYLDSANTAQRPRQVMEAMEDYFKRYNANIHRAVYGIGEEATRRFEAVRDQVTAHIGARSRQEVVFTRGTTEAINLVARTWGEANIKAGDTILLTILEHHSNIVPWQMLAEKTGVQIVYVDIDDNGELRLEQFHKLLVREPKLVALTQVSNAIGTRNPVREMAAAAKAAGATVLIDGAQAVPHQKVDVGELGCDFYAFSGHKALGPTGVGVLWGKSELLEAMPPFLGGGDMIKRVSVLGTQYNDLPWKFEAGTQAVAEVISLGAGIDYLEGINLEALAVHEHGLAAALEEALGEIGGCRVLGPPLGRRAGIVSFVVEGVHAHDLATIADREGVCVRAGHHCAMPLMTRLGVDATIRASFHCYNNLEDVERLARGVKEAVRILR